MLPIMLNTSIAVLVVFESNSFSIIELFAARRNHTVTISNHTVTISNHTVTIFNHICPRWRAFCFLCEVIYADQIDCRVHVKNVTERSNLTLFWIILMLTQGELNLYLTCIFRWNFLASNHPSISTGRYFLWGNPTFLLICYILQFCRIRKWYEFSVVWIFCGMNFLW